MPKPTPCTNCNTPGTGLFCQDCGTKQPDRFPENDLSEFHINRYLTAKATLDGLPDGVDDTPATKRVVARYQGATARLMTLHALCTEVRRPFQLPPELVDDDTPPNETP